MKRGLLAAALAGLIVAVALPVYLMSDSASAGLTRSPYAAAEPGLAVRGACPFLLVADRAGSYPLSSYLAEIIRSEGWPCAQQTKPDDLTSDTLDGVSLLLLTRVDLTDPGRRAVRAFVAGGGRVVAMRPDAELSDVFGVTVLGTESPGGYLLLDAGHPAAAGLPVDALPIHASIGQYQLAGARPVGWWLDQRGGAPAGVAVATHAFGEGRAVLWAFDLGEQVALARQGDPARADQERDGLEGIRAVDLFADRLDASSLSVPYADEQQRLLGNLLVWSLAGSLPLPRIWYLPAGVSAVLVATSDAHENIEETIDEVVRIVESRRGHVSIFYTPPTTASWRRALRRARWAAADLPAIGDFLRNATSLPSPSGISRWTSRGHDFSPHPDGLPSAEAGLADTFEEFAALGYPVQPESIRTHRILWHGWTDSARDQAARGVRMNLDYYHVGPAFRTESGEWAWGHFTGSALPMRFVDLSGRVIDNYQQPTQFVDEHVLGPLGGFAGLSVEQALEVLDSLLPRPGSGRAVAIAAQFHVDPFAVGGASAGAARRLLEGALDLASRRGAPIVSAREWLAFVTARDATAIQDLSWDEDAGALTFRVATAPPARFRTGLLIPALFEERELVGVEIDGQPAGTDPWLVAGAPQRLVALETGDVLVRAAYARPVGGTAPEVLEALP